MKAETLPQQGAAQELIQFCQALSLEAMPRSVAAYAKWCLLDSLGCALFGSRQPWATIMADEMLAEGSRGRSSILGRSETLVHARHGTPGGPPRRRGSTRSVPTRTVDLPFGWLTATT